MKTKTDYFTKFITFCVLALFLITNMIFFTSCDNGNSPNDNTNEEQNNNVPTDYCEICDGVQTENCGIEHKCNDENCVEYADKKIYKNGHTHDYCENNDCDGSTHEGQVHPTGTEYPSWFKPVSIGGSDLYQVYCIDNIQYNKDNDFTTESKVNDYLEAYIDYINSLTLNENLTSNVENNLNNIKSYPTSQKLDLLIGTTANDTGTIYSQINGINDICKQAIEKIAQKICTSPLNKTVFKFSYKTMHNEVYREAYELDITSKKTLDGTESSFGEKQYIQTKADCSVHDGKEALPFSNKCFYLESGELNPEVVGYFDKMIEQAATDLRVDINDLRNIIKLSFATSATEGILDLLCPSLNIDPESCKNNEMYDIIDGINISKITAKLNSSIFVQDFGRELC